MLCIVNYPTQYKISTSGKNNRVKVFQRSSGCCRCCHIQVPTCVSPSLCYASSSFVVLIIFFPPLTTTHETLYGESHFSLHEMCTSSCPDQWEGFLSHDLASPHWDDASNPSLASFFLITWLSRTHKISHTELTQKGLFVQTLVHALEVKSKLCPSGYTSGCGDEPLGIITHRHWVWTVQKGCVPGEGSSCH